MGQQLMLRSLFVTLSTSLTYGLKHWRQTMCRVVVCTKRELMSSLRKFPKHCLRPSLTTSRKIISCIERHWLQWYVKKLNENPSIEKSSFEQGTTSKGRYNQSQYEVIIIFLEWLEVSNSLVSAVMGRSK